MSKNQLLNNMDYKVSSMRSAIVHAVVSLFVDTYAFIGDCSQAGCMKTQP